MDRIRQPREKGSSARPADENSAGVSQSVTSVVLATAGFDHKIRFWEAATGACYRELPYNDSQVNCLRITPDKQFLAVAGNPHVRLYEIPSANDNPLLTFDGHTANVTNVGFQKDRKWMYTGSEDGTVKIWDIRSPGHQRNFGCKAAINALALHPNQGEIIAGDEDGFIRVWDLISNTCTYELVPDGKCAIRSITVASDASLVLATNNRGTVFVWKLGDGLFEPLKKIDAHNTYCLKIALSPDVKLLATGSADKTVKIWNVDKDFELQKTLTGHTSWVWDLAFSADTNCLVTASSDRTARLWNLKEESYAAIQIYKGHSKAVTSVALHDSSI